MCGIVGIFGHPEASKLACLALYASSTEDRSPRGSSPRTGGSSTAAREWATCPRSSSRDVLGALPGDCALGHVRYSTYGDSDPAKRATFLGAALPGPIAVAHNGNLVDAGLLRGDLEGRGIHLPDDDRHRGGPPPRGAVARAGRRGRDRRRGSGKVPARTRWCPGAGAPHRCARSHGVPAAISRAPRQGLGPRERDLRLRPPRRREGQGSRARGSPRGGRRRGPLLPPVPAGAPRPLRCTSTSISAPSDSDLFGRSVQAVRKRLGGGAVRGAARGGGPGGAVPDSGNFARSVRSTPRECRSSSLTRNHYIGRTFIERASRSGTSA